MTPFQLARRAALALAVSVGLYAPSSDAAVCQLSLAEMDTKVDINRQGGGSLFVNVDVKVFNNNKQQGETLGTFLFWGPSNSTLQFDSLCRTHFITPVFNWLVPEAGLCNGFLAYQLL